MCFVTGQQASKRTPACQYTYTDGVPPQRPLSQQPPVNHDDAPSPATTARQETAISQASASEADTPTYNPQQSKSATAQTPVIGDTVKQQPEGQALSIALSPEVKAFLEKPVAGPYRPIIFDLETTGTPCPGLPLLYLPCPALPGPTLPCLATSLAILGPNLQLIGLHIMSVFDSARFIDGNQCCRWT